MFRASSAHLQEDSCICVAYGTVTLYESSWWPVGTQLELELTHSSCVPTGHTGTLIESDSTIECVQLYPPEDEHLRLERCRGE
jgi:hypothetical protein